MNYQKLYDSIIIMARHRSLQNEYTEKHHIIPRCLSGTDDNNNIAILTAREHFICHYLLTKIYTKESFKWYKMNHAFMIMKASSYGQHRYINSRLYESVRKQFSKMQSKKMQGSGNGMYGRRWYHCPETLNYNVYYPGEQPNLWHQGKTPNSNKCKICGKKTRSKLSKLCDYHREEVKNNSNRASGEKHRKRKDTEDYAIFKEAIETSSSWKEAISKAGFKTEGYSRTRLQRFSKTYNIHLNTRVV